MLNELYEKIEAVLNALDTGGEQSRAFAGEIALLKETLGYPGPIQNRLDELDRRRMLSNKLLRLAIEADGIMIPLPDNPVAQWFDGTYQDTHIDMHFAEVDLAKLLEFIVEVGLSQYSDASKDTAQCHSIAANISPSRFEITLQEQAPTFPPKDIKLHLLAEGGQLWIQPEGYGEKCTEDGGGSPVGMEIWQGRLRLIAFTDINKEDPQIIDLEKARECCRDILD